MSRVLIAEDDRIIANAAGTHLRRAGIEVEWCDRGDEALRRLRMSAYDAAIVDLMLPGMDGWRLIEELRSSGNATPVIVISARTSEQDRVHALTIGADDYLAKPFGMAELVARVGAAVRRGGTPRPEAPGRIEVPGLVIDPDLHQAFVEGEDARLTPTEFRVISVLASEMGRAVDRDTIQQRVWGMPYRPRDRSIDVCVRGLREKIDERSATHSYIHTHHGIGYRFEPTAKALVTVGGGPGQ
jgi:DNA-binding response OmpR family regulator